MTNHDIIAGIQSPVVKTIELICIEEGEKTPHVRVRRPMFGVSLWKCTVCGATRTLVNPS